MANQPTPRPARDAVYRELKTARPGLAVAELLDDLIVEYGAEVAKLVLSGAPTCNCSSCRAVREALSLAADRILGAPASKEG